jgi:hypothetical protein
MMDTRKGRKNNAAATLGSIQARRDKRDRKSSLARRMAILRSSDVKVCQTAAPTAFPTDTRAVTKAFAHLTDHLSSRRVRGANITEEESEQALTVVSALILALGGLKNNIVQIQQIVHQTLGFDAKTLGKIVNTWVDDEDYYVTDSTRPGAPSRTPFQREAVISLAEKFVNQGRRKGQVTTTDSARAHIKEQLGYECSRYYMKKVFDELEMEYGPLRIDWSAYYKSDKRKAQMRRYTLLYDRALKMEATGEAIIAYYDESYVDTCHHARRGFRRADEATGFFPKGTGKRVVVMHCLTKYGMLAEVTYNMDGSFTMATPSPTQPDMLFVSDVFSAEGMFELKKGSDYHETGDLMLRYMQHCVLPTVKKLFPGKKVFFVLDNASTHHARTDGQFNPLSATVTKKSYIEKLIEHGCTHLTYYKNEKERTIVINEALIGARASQINPHIPSAKELAQAAFTWVKTNKPHLLFTDLQKYSKANGITLIFTVPYAPESQPIEMVWGAMKEHMSFAYDGDKETETIMERIRTALYEKCSLRMTSVTEENAYAARYISHATRWGTENLGTKVSDLVVGGALGSLTLVADMQTKID